MPIFRRLPKRGFSNFDFRDEYEIVNVAELERCFADGDTVDLDVLRKMRLVQAPAARVKILAKGAFARKLTVHAHAFSKKAREVIEAAGGSVHVIASLDRAAAARAKRNTAKSRSADSRPNRLQKKKSASAQDQPSV
jgi:ribosomal protein L18E